MRGARAEYVAHLEAELVAANSRIDDLLNRLAARSYESYAAIGDPDVFLAANPPPAPKRKLFDATGLLEVEIDEDTVE